MSKLPTCGDCMVTYKVEKIGIRLVELDEELEEHAIWSCDLLKCPSCDHELYSGWGEAPLTTRFSSDWTVYHGLVEGSFT